MPTPGLSYKLLPVVFGASSTASGVVNLENLHIIGIVMPATWTAAGITFLTSVDNVTYNTTTDVNATEISISVSASKHVVVNPTTVPSARYVKLQSGTTSVTVTQVSATTLTLVCREYS